MSYSFTAAIIFQRTQQAFLKAAQAVYGAEKSFIGPDSFKVISTRPVYIPEAKSNLRYLGLRSSDGTYSVFREDKIGTDITEPNGDFLRVADAIHRLKELESASEIKNQSVPYNHYSRVEDLFTDWPERQYFAADSKGDQDHAKARERYHKKFCPSLSE